MFYKVLEFTLSITLYNLMSRLTLKKKKVVWFLKKNYVFIICMAV